MSTTSLSNTAGSLVNTYTYDSFGKLTASTGTVANPFRFTGREFDSETGLYYYRARYYDALTGRFITEDPTDFDGGDANFYRYVFNSPAIFIDPTGLRCSCIYSISTGHFVCYGPGDSSPRIDTYGYAGYPPYTNDVASTDVPGNLPRTGGALPLGQWAIGPGFTGTKGNPQFQLFPRNTVIPPGRLPNSFLIHADSNKHPGQASNGCIALPDIDSRRKLRDCGVGPLDVIP